uniref:Uncharacterized protein n=1 Tax=Arundo donax TaxID=35708 RepID=A0A0A9F165_ARUDO
MTLRTMENCLNKPLQMDLKVVFAIVATDVAADMLFSSIASDFGHDPVLHFFCALLYVFALCYSFTHFCMTSFYDALQTDYSCGIANHDF